MRHFLTMLLTFLPLMATAGWKDVRSKPAEWFTTDEAKAVAANVLSWQTDKGDWPKNLETFDTPFDGNSEKPRGTFDNGATVNEVRFLARMAEATGDDTYEAAANKAIDHIIAAQYLNGGFPQRSPPDESYRRYITFNDGTMVNLLQLLWEVAHDDTYSFAGDDRRHVAGQMVQAGVRCILACQHQGRHGLTIWAAQYDERTLKPRPARPFEPVSLASAESAGVLMFLMSFENPSPQVVLSVEAGVNWFNNARLQGLRIERTENDVEVVADPQAPHVWARFYDVDSMRPLFAGRDGVVKYALADIEQERRTGYAWYGRWGDKVLREYPKWRKRIAEDAE